MRRSATALVLVALGVGLVGCERRASYSKGRLTPEAIQQTVEGPIAVVRQKSLTDGIKAFNELRVAKEARYGKGSAQVADLFEAFGVQLFSVGFEDGQQAALPVSVDYLREAIPRYREAFGPKHPEVAVALHSLADAETQLNGGQATREAQAALEEAVQIRRIALGTGDAETVAAETALARAEKKRAGVRRPVNTASEAVDAADDAVSTQNAR